MVILSLNNHISPTIPSSNNFRVLDQPKYLYGLFYLNKMKRNRPICVLHEYLNVRLIEEVLCLLNSTGEEKKASLGFIIIIMFVNY